MTVSDEDLGFEIVSDFCFKLVPDILRALLGSNQTIAGLCDFELVQIDALLGE